MGELSLSGNQKPLDLDERPRIPKGSHPIERGRYLLATNEVNRMYEVVSQWIQNRTPGAIIHGRPRIGKSKAIEYLMHLLPDEFGEKLPVFFLNCRQYRTPSENVFFEDLLKDVGHGIIFSGKPSIKRDRLSKFLLERGAASGQNRIIFFIDDAQNLSEIQYRWLMDIYNELDRHGIFLTAILVGQNELLHQRSAFIKSKKAQIIGRFMVFEHKFTGVQKEGDLRTCLAGYDEDSEYPEGSGWSFTRYYFPEAFKDGFRLQDHAEELFDVFKELRRAAGLKNKVEIPMQYLTLTVEYCLRRFGANGDDLRFINRAQWQEAVDKSGYIAAEIYQNFE